MNSSGTSSRTRRFFLGALLASAAAPALANAPVSSLRPRLRGDGEKRVALPKVASAEDLVRDAGLKGRIGYAVADAKSGLVLESRESTLGLPPASVTKSLTALYALATLGAEHRFETRLVATGPLDAEGVLNGDLVLAGGGDPTLDTDGLARLIAAAKAAGLRKVTGRFLVWGGALPYAREIDRGQPDHLSYSPALSGIALNFNTVHFEWSRVSAESYDVTMQARTAKYRPDVATARMQVVDRGMPVYTYEDRDGIDSWTVARGQLGKGGSRYLPVRRPEAYAGDVLRTLAVAQDIALPIAETADTAPQGTDIAVERSDTLREILRAMLKYSNNLIAEMVGMSTTAARDAVLHNLRDSAAEMNRWAAAELGLDDPALVDHSGLGDASRLSPADMTKALVAVHGSDTLKPILKQIALRDAKGRPTKSHPVRVVAKTGTLNFVSALAGYITAPDGTELAFAVFTADMDRRAELSEAERERPEGARSWNARSRLLQLRLVERWGTLYGS